MANAVAAAKQASQNVLIAQQQVQVAKENVLNQQRLAAEKETHATILNQKKAAESAAAAQSVVLAQQRLAAAKNAVAHQQRIAASKEAHAVSALQNSPNTAYAELQRTGKKIQTFRFLVCSLFCLIIFSQLLKVTMPPIPPMK